MVQHLTAIYDGHNLTLEHPLNIPVNTRIKVAIEWKPESHKEISKLPSIFYKPILVKKIHKFDREEIYNG